MTGGASSLGELNKAFISMLNTALTLGVELGLPVSFSGLRLLASHFEGQTQFSPEVLF